MLRAACFASVLACQASGLRLEASTANSGALAGLKESGESAWPSDYTMKDVIRLLWYGYDIGHEMQGWLARSPEVIYQPSHVDTVRDETKGLPPYLVILGPKDSGTSLLMELLQLNYMKEMKRACGWEHYWIDHDRPWLGHLYCRVWSHGLIDETVPEGAKSLYKVLSHQPNITIANTVALFVVKSPFATLESWRTAFREKNACIKRPAAEWGTHCTASDVGWKDWGNRNKEAKLEVKTTMDLYNKYMRTGSHANPRLLCNHSHLPEKCPEGGCKISDFTDCPCALLDGTPEIGESWTDIDPKEDLQVRGLLQRMRAWGSRCYSADKFLLRGAQDRKYNFLDYVGTQFLAYDIERMRRAIGGPKMSIYGFSYGSLVGAVYATVFASHVGAVVLDGNMDPFPQKQSQSLGIASENDGGVDKLLLTCQRAPERCSLKEPEQEYSEILESARAGNLTAPTRSGMSFKLTVGMLMAYLQFELRQNTGQGFPRATATLAALSPRSSDGAGRSAAVARILDGYCAVKGRPTWFHHYVCVGPGQTGEQEGTVYGEPYLEQCAVVGVDHAGALGLRDALSFLHFFGGRYGDAGLAALVTNVASFSFWPATATPIAPIGNPYVRALVIGNLFDFSTSYEWSQRMSKAFPAGALMTWQGVGHTLPDASRSYDPEGTARCQERVKAYLRNGTLPVDGFVCVQRRPVPVGL